MQAISTVSRAIIKPFSDWWNSLPALAKVLFGGYLVLTGCHLAFAVWLFNQLQQGIPADMLLGQPSIGSALYKVIQMAIVSEMCLLLALQFLGTTAARKFRRINREAMSYYSFKVFLPMIIGSICFIGLYVLIVAACSAN